MTNEEKKAIEILEEFRTRNLNFLNVSTLKAIDIVVKSLEQTRWIPVSERLPEEMGTYMTTIDYGKFGLATGQRYYFGQGVWEDDCVIAWQPLPQPYKAESEDKGWVKSK